MLLSYLLSLHWSCCCVFDVTNLIYFTKPFSLKQFKWAQMIFEWEKVRDTKFFCGGGVGMEEACKHFSRIKWNSHVKMLLTFYNVNKTTAGLYPTLTVTPYRLPIYNIHRPNPHTVRMSYFLSMTQRKRTDSHQPAQVPVLPRQITLTKLIL